MPRLLLILALVCTGLAPGATCLHAAMAQASTVAAEASGCRTPCCGPACCCVAESESSPLPKPPATPPTGPDQAPTFLITAQPFVLSWDDPAVRPSTHLSHPRHAVAESRRAVQALTGCWLI
jgi:hypothetical protein